MTENHLNTNPPISIVIPNYNGADLLRKNIPAVIAALDFYNTNFEKNPNFSTSEIIVVDDGSSDDSDEALKKFPQVTALRHTTNKGYSDAVYSGIQAAHNEIIVLLNSDVNPRCDFLSYLMEAFEDPLVFATSPLIYDENGTPIQASWNRPYIHHGKLQLTKWNPNEIPSQTAGEGRLYHLFASGGSMALRRSKFLGLGGYLDLFKPFYYEDMDLGIRAWRRGWKVVFEPRSVVIHPQGSTIKRFHKQWKIKIIMQRNRLLLQWLHLPRYTLLKSHFPRLLIRYIEHLLRLNVVAWAALWVALYKLPTLVKERNKMTKSETRNLFTATELISAIPQK